MLRFLADDLPAHWSLPLVWPAVFSFLAIYVYSKALGVQRYEGPPKWKIAWLLVAAVGLGFGLFQASKMTEPVYRSFASGNGMKMVLAHYMAAALPLLTIAAVLIYDMANRRSKA